jgi:ribonuclease T2
VQSYFQLSRQLFRSIRVPKEFVNPFETQFFAPQDVKQALIAANPGLRPDAIAVVCGRGSRPRLSEVRICFSKEGKAIACGPNEDERKLCSAGEVALPPVRSTMRDDSQISIPKQSPLPGPR